MNAIKKILAVLDPSKEQQKGLLRSFELARKSGASITAFLSVYDFSYEMTTMLSLEERDLMRSAVIKSREDWIKSLIGPYLNDLNIDLKVVWHNRPFEAVIQTVLSDGYDMVIKGTHQHDTLKSVLFTPTDWHLIRKCPCPVLLVKEHDWQKQGSILAAVHSSCEDKEHQGLNHKIIKDAQFIAQLVQADVHLVNSYAGTPINIAIEIPEFNVAEFNTSVKNHHLKCTAELAEQFSVAPTHCHVKEGLPEDVIPVVANELDVELVVIGTVGRTGLSAALMGNTAEHVIDGLNCDVLALKPEGYKSPLDK
ncbi:universal stress protein UspE [Pseudoalteromonas tunicata]|uniref:Putative universal stress protein n=1 Tax=Pseudoalteromonas tunicata D2 TaxID=87626 RepID=A4CAS5_9GAMM|nr:universal stress protein UspE [Pseudoalteromonas tunicata]ATC95030.1 universal stress protein E [Pseudoalteromonas tunicata]AXT30684.1 universal stress protein UspE [Pseudoalteromonas tunicata]EAR28483.1 putative universal stress protein [Pseudoalteromonas tunicata D2]MDP4983356.1 universal stress protein UspE [Pseudoalteromonas tunicata]